METVSTGHSCPGADGFCVFFSRSASDGVLLKKRRALFAGNKNFWKFVE